MPDDTRSVRPPALDASAGQAVYTPLVLAAYDLAVVAFSNTVIWRCPSRKMLALYNRRGIFSNLQDDLDGLRESLATRFERHEVEICGRVALFWAR